MESQKLVSNILPCIYTKKYINYNETRLKTINLVFIVDMFLNNYVFYKRDNIRLNSRVLKNLYGSTYPQYLNYLIDNNFIYLYKNYSVGRKSKTYRLTPLAKENRYLFTRIKEPAKLVAKIESLQHNYNNITESVKKKIITDLFDIDVDYKNAINWINDNLDFKDRSHFLNTTNINKINNGSIFYSFDAYGRFHTNYTTLKREIRSKFLYYKGEKLVELDITNSQPFFLYLLMKQKGFTDFQDFDYDVLNGIIYDRIVDLTATKRKDVKKNIYSVLFGRNMSKGYWNELFNNMYPKVYKWIKNYKKQHKNYKIIAHELQAIEADFIFNNLIPQIMCLNSNIPTITIHDSIMIPMSNYSRVKEIFDTSLNKLIKSSSKNILLDL